MAALALCAVLFPVARSSDGFPLSNYPMFLQARPDITTFDVAIGVAEDGTEHQLSPSLVGGSIEVIQAVAVVEDAVADDTTAALCARIAARVSQTSSEASTVSVAVITETYEIVPALADDAPPIDRVIHSSCPVRR